MLDKLNLNKALILLLLLASSCNKGERIYMFPDTEISCDDGLVVLVKYAKMDDVKKGIAAHIEDKKFHETSDNYTAIKFPDGRSFKIDKKSPEETMKCNFRETQYAPVKGKYLYGTD